VGADLIRTSQDELQKVFSGWRKPLAEPVNRTIRNPFTGMEQDVWSWDPEPNTAISPHAIVASALTTIDYSGFELSGVNALIDVLLPDETRSLRASLFCPAANQTHAFERKPALIGPEFNFLWEVPAPLVSRLARVSEAGLPGLGAMWAVAFRTELRRLNPNAGDVLADAYYEESLRRVSAFAREAVASRQRVFEWAYE
jgi:hypothetical protein